MANEKILDLTYNNHVEPGRTVPCIAWGTEPPLAGQWRVGDTVYNLTPVSGGTTGWICTASGAPGIWTTLPETVA